MNALFADFSAIDKSLEDGLISALRIVEQTYINAWDNSVKRTVAHWNAKFGKKCPKTVKRFIEEYEKDSADFFEKVTPDFALAAAVWAPFSPEEYMQHYIDLGKKKTELYNIAGDVADDGADISEHIEAKHNLITKFLADKKNTAILAALQDDEDGEKAQYTKLESCDLMTLRYIDEEIVPTEGLQQGQL